ncbi:hypothetical protein G7048_05200 [Diaphorobacter sp. HDW4B]|uniref:hypothetical protein n=1 Tax=Diaphorobacter sp. HDW4B TaxID=2714925 RepID=UPI001408F653|nr:hypothetical protein [Diaphorobacter sp. HDW4B]QIL69810.1 hypothetical protein G7048_05200 [Diaphorobacter sp. HDW4B]
MKWVWLITGLLASSANALPLLAVSETAWQGLETHEKAEIQRSYLIETVRDSTFGLIIDNQGVDRSTPGTHGGAVLGSAIADVSYIDRAFSGGHYSAKTHLGVVLLGGLLGSALDKAPQRQFQFRYAIKLQDGSVVYQDKYSTEPFRHPAGICVMLSDLSVAANQNLCSQTPDVLRATYVRQTALNPSNAFAATSSVGLEASPISSPPRIQPMTSNSVSCKLNSLPPVQTTLDKCNAINGRVINE